MGWRACVAAGPQPDACAGGASITLRPDAFLPDLATSLNNQSNSLGDLGRRKEALAAIEEAVKTYRGLAAARPDAFLPALATSLNNQANRLSNVGRREEALAATEDALHVVLPALERAHYVLPDAGLRLVRSYVESCEQVGRKPDSEVIQRMHAVLAAANSLSPDEKHDQPE